LQDEAPENVKELIQSHTKEGIIEAAVYQTLPDDVKHWLKDNSTILLNGLDDFANQVSDNLWSMFCEAFPELNEAPKAAADIETREDDEHLRFIDEITELFVGREPILKEIE
jgi:hypothetical protein